MVVREKRIIARARFAERTKMMMDDNSRVVVSGGSPEYCCTS